MSITATAKTDLNSSTHAKIVEYAKMLTQINAQISAAKRSGSSTSTLELQRDGIKKQIQFLQTRMV